MRTSNSWQTPDIHPKDTTMWDTVEAATSHLSHDLPCTACGHGRHTYLPCSDACSCTHGRDRVLSYA